MTERSTIPGLFCFFIAFYFSLSGRRNGILYHENVFKWYNRGLKTCFVRGKRFRRNKTVCDVDDLVIVSMGARRVELDCAGPPHWRGSPPFSGANAGSAHSARRAVSVSCFCRFSLSLFPVGNKTEFCTAKTF